MPVDFAAVDRIIRGNGSIRFGIDTSGPADGGIKQDGRVKGGYKMADIVIGVNEIKMTPRAGDDGAAVNVLYETGFATVGAVDAPSYIYSDSFAGCAFYMYRGFVGEMHGVHASRDKGNAVDPTDYFRRRGAKLLWSWFSKSTITDAELMANKTGAVFCAVDQAKVVGYAVVIKNQQVLRVIDTFAMDNWRSEGA